MKKRKVLIVNNMIGYMREADEKLNKSESFPVCYLDEKWNQRYQEVVNFIETNHRNPSRHRIEEHDLLNWLKANRKLMVSSQFLPYCE